eukprot:CAMPEP_0204609684 /NCGR_PEP_ID=MMETSP0661-20131031/61064_1 /ASSEMBLY_ACC=CAM_ASM_000606 /TAXON_ID=109239 /ORGANISM="Alexandrium margalefi, Strain AMGDE01CS-322" /LENGTH=57 /DNA_ID=CAMNT_0051621389 /DNA_START=149 /DNA_END=319 /DNA_ORIENTATION=-
MRWKMTRSRWCRRQHSPRGPGQTGREAVEVARADLAELQVAGDVRLLALHVRELDFG